MLDSSIEYLHNNNNNKSQEIILNCKYQIKLLSFYLMSTFKQIETALEKSEELLNGIPKKKKNMNKDSSITSTNSETVNSEEKLEDFIESFKGIYNNENIGKYYWKIRVLKILKYKIKQIIRQGKTPIMTKYYGRSKVASQKPRFHGRFVKKSKI
jgi:hypothetical protein